MIYRKPFIIETWKQHVTHNIERLCEATPEYREKLIENYAQIYAQYMKDNPEVARACIADREGSVAAFFMLATLCSSPHGEQNSEDMLNQLAREFKEKYQLINTRGMWKIYG